MFTTEGHVIRLGRGLRRDVNQEFGMVPQKGEWMCKQDLPVVWRNQSAHTVSGDLSVVHSHPHARA